MCLYALIRSICQLGMCVCSTKIYFEIAFTFLIGNKQNTIECLFKWDQCLFFYICSNRINVYLSRINNFRSQEALMLKACLNKQEHFGEEVPF